VATIGHPASASLPRPADLDLPTLIFRGHPYGRA
jgi:hypothetical protein